MTTFKVEFYPPLPAAPHLHSIMSLSDMELRKIIEAHPEEYDIRYYVDGRMFCYYPASILTVINDILLELDLARQRKSHDMTLSGYATLGIEFNGEQAIFYDPLGCIDSNGKKFIGNSLEASIIEHAFKSAAESLWFLIKNAE